jgi:tRNA pseudouridine38-40 synthase
MSRFFIHLSYKGTKYNGWQAQSNGITVQGLLVEKLSVLLKHPVSVTGAGRTDTGVHALNFYAHFDSNKLQINDLSSLGYHLNSILPNDIAVKSIIPVKPEAHARFSALSRSYEYHIHFRKDPFLEGLSYCYFRALDRVRMNEACKLLMEFNDFKSFSRNHTDVKTYICKITQAEWISTEDSLIFYITADRFLRNMVRAIVGTMLEIGKGNKTIDDFKKIILSRERSEAGQSVPAEGLFLSYINYPKDIFF